MRLNGQEWEIGSWIGGGGFGQVYEAKSHTGETAVIKFVPKAPGAEREMLFVDLTNARNVVPVIDHGETEGYWVLVMPRAEKSLRHHLDEAAGPLSIAEVIKVLSDITTALTDLDRRVVHRDLKPQNVLLLNGKWCLADFGISRYAEATTAPDTQKYAMSPPYAAPERWRGQRATIATDIYSLGIIAYELFSGSLPFIGPNLEDFRDQHLHYDPPSLGSAPTGVAALVDECLYKAAEARPSPANVLARLAQAAKAPSLGGLTRLQEANRAEAARRGVEARQASQSQSEAERRDALNHAAYRSLTVIMNSLRQAIEEVAPLVEFETDLGPDHHTGIEYWSARLNQGRFYFGPGIATVSSWDHQPQPAFEVTSWSKLSLQNIEDGWGVGGRSHSLWFCDAHEPGNYQWFETAFMISPLYPESLRESFYGPGEMGFVRGQEPFALGPGPRAAEALGQGMADIQVAWPFTPLIISDLDDFIIRWTSWFADAAYGKLNRPATMPERPTSGTWRQS